MKKAAKKAARKSSDGPPTIATSIRLEPEIIEWFDKKAAEIGSKSQTLMKLALRAAMRRGKIDI